MNELIMSSLKLAACDMVEHLPISYEARKVFCSQLRDMTTRRQIVTWVMDSIDSMALKTVFIMQVLTCINPEN